MSGFQAVAWILVSLYTIICIISTQFKYSESLFTTQTQVHILIGFFSLIRAIFFIVSSVVWDESDGTVHSDQVFFYFLDEFATMLFFSLCCVLTLFSAELYHTASDGLHTFNTVIKPISYALNVLAYIAILICIVLVHLSSESLGYSYFPFSLIAAILYFIAAFSLALYAYYAGNELNKVPIHLSIRQNRIYFLRIVASIIFPALTIKAILLIVMAGRTFSLSSSLSLTICFFYFFLLEILPISIVLGYYREVDEDKTEAYRDNTTRSEVRGLLSSSSSHHSEVSRKSLL